MVKIHILGGMGSGKTTFAQELSFRLCIPYYNLDKVNPQQESSVAIAEQPAWITEGIYLIATEPMLYHADYIVVFTVPLHVAVWRVVYRHFANSIRGTQDYPGIKGLKALAYLIRGACHYYLNLDHAALSTVEALHTYIEVHRAIAAPPTEEFVQMYSEAYREMIVPPNEKFVQMYLEIYKTKVFFVKNHADRARLLEVLMQKEL